MESREALQQPVQPAVHPNMMMGPTSYSSTMLTSNASSMINSNSVMAAGSGFFINSMLQPVSRPMDSLNAGVYDGSLAGLRPCDLDIELPKKKRGRPRKYAPEGNIALELAPAPGSASMSRGGEGSSTPSSETPVKRSRGRPPGSAKKQLDALGPAVTCWTPHLIKVEAGEDITSKIMAFTQQGPRAVCILSATGTICNVAIRKDTLSSGAVNYEGAFNIISLSGFFSPSEDDESHSSSGLNVLLGGPDALVIGGRVAGRLMAATPVQVIVGSFTLNDKKINSNLLESGPPSAPPPNVSNFGPPSMAESPRSRRVSSESSGENGQSPLNRMPPGVYGNASQTMQHMQMYQYGMGQNQR